MFNITKTAEKQVRYANHLGLLSNPPTVSAFKFPYFLSQGTCMKIGRKGDRFATILSFPMLGILLYLGWQLSSFQSLIVYSIFLLLLLPHITDAIFYVGVRCFSPKTKYVIMVWGRHWQWVLKHEVLELIQMETKLEIVAHIEEINPKW